MKPLNEMTDAERKELPIFEGPFTYFPNAIALVAKQCLKGQQQHGGDKPLQWLRHLSRDERGSLGRHMLDYGVAWVRRDYAGLLDATMSMTWRALAHAERFIATTDEDPEHYQIIKRMRGK